MPGRLATRGDLVARELHGEDEERAEIEESPILAPLNHHLVGTDAGQVRGRAAVQLPDLRAGLRAPNDGPLAVGGKLGPPGSSGPRILHVSAFPVHEVDAAAGTGFRAVHGEAPGARNRRPREMASMSPSGTAFASPAPVGSRTSFSASHRKVSRRNPFAVRRKRQRFALSEEDGWSAVVPSYEDVPAAGALSVNRLRKQDAPALGREVFEHRTVEPERSRMRPLSRSPKIKTPRGRLSCTRTLGRLERCAASELLRVGQHGPEGVLRESPRRSDGLPGITSAEKEPSFPSGDQTGCPTP